MEPQFVALITLLIAVLLVIIREAFRRPFFLLAFVLMLVVFSMVVGNPVGLLTSFGGWAILVVMLLAARILALAVPPRGRPDSSA
jgi:hypothetical protein